MTKIRAYVTSLIASVVLVLFGAPAMAGITAEQKDLLNNHFSPSVAAKVQLGTLIDSADTVVSADITDATIVAADLATGAVTSAKVLDDTLVVADLNTSVMVEATGTLSQANLVAMNGAAVTLLAAPGAGKVIVVDSIELFHDYAVAAYTNGGDVTIEYATSGTDIQVFDVAVVTGAADGNYIVKPTAAYSASGTASSEVDLSTSANKAVTITNATAAFATGDATNVVKWRIRYHVVTLLT